MFKRTIRISVALISGLTAFAADDAVMARQELAPAHTRFDAVVHRVTEIAFTARTPAGDPFLDADVDGIVIEPDGTELRVPAFWAGGNCWKLRYSPRVPGRHTFRLLTARGSTVIAAPAAGELEARAYIGTNVFLRHGPVRYSSDRRYFAHADGTPFFWLADSWWHAMTSRLTDDGFATLVADRRRKGFNTIQFAVAFPCDIAPFDERGGNAAGHAWEKDFRTINPAYWDLTDRRVEYLVQHEMMPSIVGAWGYYINFMGVEKMKLHWRYIVARYGAFPVAWTLCGESRLPWYPNIGTDSDQGYRQTFLWAEVAKSLRAGDPFRRLIGVHPGPPLWFHEAKYDALPDYSNVDMYFGMGGHGGGGQEYAQVNEALKVMDGFCRQNPGKQAIVGELAWEGMFGGSCGSYIQRIQFWGSVLRGAPGHCYGTDSLWQMNTRAQPFGESASGYTWGNAPWEDAYQWPGSTQVGLGRRLLERYEWWRFEPHSEWVAPTEEKDGRSLLAAAAGIPGRVRMIYFARQTQSGRAPYRLRGLIPGIAYRAFYFSPIDGREYPIATPVAADAAGESAVPRSPINQDWVLVLED